MREYILEECTLYDYLQINGKDVYIFESHNMALPVWGTYSNRLNTNFNLVTFDSHTDTRPPFCAEVIDKTGRYDESNRECVEREILEGKYFEKENFCFEDVFKIACQYLKNDEHILTASYFGYIKSYTVICDLDEFEAEGYEREDLNSGYNASYYVRRQQSEIEYNDIETPLILDFDLDYFINNECIDNNFKESIVPLIEKATVITIAKEEEYFNSCKEQDGYTCEDVLQDVLKMIRDSL